MPYADPVKQREYQRRHGVNYRRECREEIKRRQAAWYAANRETCLAKNRVYRRERQAQDALAILGSMTPPES